MSNNNQISVDDQKRIMLHIMDEIDAFCKSNSLTYFLIGGSLLGAVRHKGYIPWDDDIDIGLPRKDYEYLLEYFSSSSGNVEIRSVYNQKHFMWPNAKAIDNRTVLIELGDKKNAIGVHIDVFPFDYLPGNYEQALRVVKKIRRWKDLLTLKHLVIDCNRSLLKNVVVVLGKVLYLIPDRYFIKKINGFQFYSREQCEFICNLCGAWGGRELSRSANFDNCVNADFEDRKYMIPVGYDDYLNTVYGDYMTPPPKEKQITHHSAIAYWK